LDVVEDPSDEKRDAANENRKVRLEVVNSQTLCGDPTQDRDAATHAYAEGVEVTSFVKSGLACGE
jgi:hypothetical protein